MFKKSNELTWLRHMAANCVLMVFRFFGRGRTRNEWFVKVVANQVPRVGGARFSCLHRGFVCCKVKCDAMMREVFTKESWTIFKGPLS